MAARAKAKQKEKEGEASAGGADDEEEDTLPPGTPALSDVPPAPKPAAAPARMPAAPPRPAPAAAAKAGGPSNLTAALSDQKLKVVFDAYVQAKRRCQEDTSKLSYDQMAANLRKQVPELVKKAGAQGVDFKVVIKDGKAILRAVPK